MKMNELDWEDNVDYTKVTLLIWGTNYSAKCDFITEQKYLP